MREQGIAMYASAYCARADPRRQTGEGSSRTVCGAGAPPSSIDETAMPQEWDCRLSVNATQPARVAVQLDPARIRRRIWTAHNACGAASRWSLCGRSRASRIVSGRSIAKPAGSSQQTKLSGLYRYDAPAARRAHRLPWWAPVDRARRGPCGGRTTARDWQGSVALNELSDGAVTKLSLGFGAAERRFHFETWRSRTLDDYRIVPLRVNRFGEPADRARRHERQLRQVGNSRNRPNAALRWRQAGCL